MKLKKFVAIFICILISASTVFISSASAASVQTVSVSGKKTVVDTMTFNGVKLKAYYAPYFWGYDSDMTSLGSKYGGYCCAGFVYQFYKRVYGVEVKNLFAERNAYGNGSGSNFKKSSLDGLYYNIPTSSEGYFYRVKEPQVGDIVASNNHWAIVKKISSSGTITLIEQNYWYNSYSRARINRKISKTNSNYWFFRFSGAVKTVNKKDDESAEEKLKTEIWTVCSDNGINVRKGAGTKYKIKSAIADGTIIHIKDKKIADGLLWGKSEFGWCALEYCDYVKGSCEKDSFTVTFSSNGETKKMSKKIYFKGSEEKLPKNKFKNGEGKFEGWKVSRESDNKWLYTNGKTQEWYSQNKQPFGFSKLVIKNKAKVSFLKTQNNEIVMLFAVWSDEKIDASDMGFQIEESIEYSSSGAKPEVKVFLGEKYIKKKGNYSIKYSENEDVGKAKVRIKLKGKYKGSFEGEFLVVPAAVSKIKAKPQKTSITLSWKRNKKAKGYIIYRLNEKTGKYKKIKTITKNNILSYEDSSLKKGTEYKYRIKAYKNVDNQYVYSAYKYITAKTK